MSELAAWKSLAKHLGRPVLDVLGMADDGTLADAIRQRNALMPAEHRASGYMQCLNCGGWVRFRQLCHCGEVSPGSLDGREALDLTLDKRVSP